MSTKLMLTWVAIVTRSVVIAQSNMATGVNVYCGEDLEDKRSTCLRAHCDRSRQRRHDQQWPDEQRHSHVKGKNSAFVAQRFMSDRSDCQSFGCDRLREEPIAERLDAASPATAS